MIAWQYALLVRRREAFGQSFRLTFTWYGPDGSRRDVTDYGETAIIPHLNRVGAEGWELVSAEEDVNNLEGTTEIHRYHLKRPVGWIVGRRRTRGRAGFGAG